jgi:hypothetical protein
MQILVVAHRELWNLDVVFASTLRGTQLIEVVVVFNLGSRR